MYKLLLPIVFFLLSIICKTLQKPLRKALEKDYNRKQQNRINTLAIAAAVCAILGVICIATLS